MRIVTIKCLTILLLGLVNNVNAQNQIKKQMKLKTVINEMVVNTSVEKVWGILADFGQVGSFHSSVKSSKSINNSENEAVLGCERECVLTDGKKPVVIKERIIEIKDNQYYTYDVYEWENFPISKMLVTYGVKLNEKGQTVIYQKNDFRLKPSFLTGLMKGKIKRGGRDSLYAYKHFMETGEKNVDIKILRKKYKNV